MIDLNVKTILPGFINTHVHINFAEPNYIKEFLYSGVTTVRDMGILGDLEISDVLEKRKTILNTNEFPRLITLGEFITGRWKIAIGTDFIEEDLPWFELGMPLYKLQLLKDAGLDNNEIISALTRNYTQ